MKKTLFLGTALAMLVLLSTSSTFAMTLGFSPSYQEVLVGTPVDVDLVISGLGDYREPSLGVFDLDITYDPTIIGFASYALGPYLGDILLGEAMDLSLGQISPGLVNVYQLSLLYANETVDPFYPPGFPPYLDDSQPSTFTLATLTFDTLDVGTSPLNISRHVLGDAISGAQLPDVVEAGSISAVPEPATMLLFASGLCVIGYLRRKRPLRL